MALCKKEHYPNIIAGRRGVYFLQVDGRTVAEFPSAELARQRSFQVIAEKPVSEVRIIHTEERFAAPYRKEMENVE